MKKSDITKFRNAFLHWRGWPATAAFFAKAWRATAGWKGWKILFGLPYPAVLILSVLCAAGLVWVFMKGMETWWPSYLLYALSAYCLTALLGKLPAALRGGKQWLSRHPGVSAVLDNRELHFRLGLYVSQFVNFAYGIFKTVSGVVAGSAWLGCDGIYNLAQAGIQLFQILGRKKAGTLLAQWRSYRSCGGLILLLHLTLIGIVFQMVNWNRVEEQGEILIIATAAFAFYKFITSFIAIAKDRKHTHPVDSSVRMLELSQANFAIFSLQAGMLHAFGTGERWEYWINLAVGCVVCLLTVAMGLYMIRRGNREIKTIKERAYGE